MLSLTKHPFRNEITIKTGLGHYAIVTYLERIMRLKGWMPNLENTSKARILLEAMAVIEWQSKLCLLVDFDEIYERLKKQTENN